MRTVPPFLQASCCLFATACGGSPAEVTLVPPELVILGASVGLVEGEGGVFVRAVTSAATAVDSTSNPGIAITLETASGDSEQAMLERLLCKRGGERQVFCKQFTVLMEQGHSVEAIVPQVRAADALLFMTRICSQEGCEPYITHFRTVRLLTGKLATVMALARTWPGVRTVDYDGFGQVQGGTSSGATSWGRYVAVAVRLRGSNSPIVGNGVLEFNETDTVVVRYRQPTGEDLVVRCAAQNQNGCGGA